MLPQSHARAYPQLLEELLLLQQEAIKPEPDFKVLQETFGRVQQVFQEIISLPNEGLEPDILWQWQSVQTEIHRALRLLGTEILFLRSSKGVATSDQRLTALRDRLNQLIGYTQVMLGAKRD